MTSCQQNTSFDNLLCRYVIAYKYIWNHMLIFTTKKNEHKTAGQKTGQVVINIASYNFHNRYVNGCKCITKKICIIR